MTDLEYIRMHLFKGTVMQNEKVLINDPLGVIQNWRHRENVKF